MESVYEYNKKLSSINYGWYDKQGNLYKGLSKSFNFKKNYYMQKVSDIIKNNHAICWELCELERTFFHKKYPYITVFAVLKDHKNMPCHTFLIFKNNQKYYWFESSWDKFKGVHEYQNISDIFTDIKNNFSSFTKTTNFDSEKISFYLYHKPLFRCTCNMFYANALIFGKEIKNQKYPI